METEGSTHPWIEGTKESPALPFDVSSRKLRGRLSGKALPHFFIPGLLLLVELLSHVWLFCDSMDCTPPGSFVHGIFQGRILGWVAISSSRGSSWPRDWVCVSCSSYITGRSFPAEPSGKPYIRPKGGEIFVAKYSHQSWEGMGYGACQALWQMVYSYHHMPAVLPDRACQTPFTVKEPEALSESLMMWQTFPWLFKWQGWP